MMARVVPAFAGSGVNLPLHIAGGLALVVAMLAATIGIVPNSVVEFVRSLRG
jgi:hypothetical protein